MQSPSSRFRRAPAAITPKVAELDPGQQACIEESLAWVRDAHQRLHEASRFLAETLSSGQLCIAESARAETVKAITAAAKALAAL